MMYRGGVAYVLGEGSAPHDVRTGKGWLRKAAELGHPRAQATLGRLVYDEMEALREQAHAQDYQAAAEAERWLTRASDQGQLDATRALVPLYVTRGDLAAACGSLVTWLWGVVMGPSRRPK